MRFVTGALVVAMTAMGSAQSADMRTRAEISNYEESSTYADVTRVIDGLTATSPLVHTESFGKTEEGRDLPLIVISDPKVTTPAAAHKLGRPMVFVQANIHAGEVEGKRCNPAVLIRVWRGRKVSVPGLVLCPLKRRIKAKLDDLVVRAQGTLAHRSHPRMGG